jgi:hypothetical protein
MLLPFSLVQSKDTAAYRLSAVIQGVDDAWEVCLLEFTIDMVGALFRRQPRRFSQTRLNLSIG